VLTPEEGEIRGSGWVRLPTAVKMLVILSLGLLPLGVAAIFASIGNARENRAQGIVQARALLAVHSQRLSLGLSRTAYTIRAARDAIAESSEGSGLCKRSLDRLARLPEPQGRFVLYGAGNRPRCASEGFAPPPVPDADGAPAHARILPGGAGLRIFLYSGTGEIEGVAEYQRAAIARAVDNPPLDGDFGLELVQGGLVMPLREIPASGSLSHEIIVDEPMTNGEFVLRLHTAVAPLSWLDVLVVIAPVLIWLWASIVVWLLVQRLLLRPLRRLQRVVSTYRPGEGPVALPAVRSPAREIGALGAAFAEVTRTVARHEADLEAAVERQTRLVREVHHRVKNNLQVVSSLLNLHSRGSSDEAVAAAYASIQRRVDALAVVHRNHYAEFEANRGVALKPLLSELAANLRATAPASAAAMQIRLDIAPVHATQDVAVPVAFLVTEIAEFGMLCGAAETSIVLEPVEAGKARLAITLGTPAGGLTCAGAIVERFERIVIGLSRQLRSQLEQDEARGLYAVIIPTI